MGCSLVLNTHPPILLYSPTHPFARQYQYLTAACLLRPPREEIILLLIAVSVSVYQPCLLFLITAKKSFSCSTFAVQTLLSLCSCHYFTCRNCDAWRLQNISNFNTSWYSLETPLPVSIIDYPVQNMCRLLAPICSPARGPD